MLKKYLLKYSWLYLLGLIAILVVDILQLKVPQYIGMVTDGLETGTIGESELLSWAFKLFFVGLIITVGRFLWRHFIFGTSRLIEFHLRNSFFQQLERLDAAFYNRNKTGDLMAYATNDLNAIRMLIGPGILMALDTLILTSIVIIQMVRTTDLSLTFFAVLPMPIIGIFSIAFGSVIEARFNDKQEAFAHMSDVVQENISGIRIIKAFVQEYKEIKAFAKANKMNYEKNMRVVRVFTVLMPLSMMITGVSIAITLGYGGRLAMLGVISLGDFVAFAQYIMLLVWPMIALGWFVNIYSQGKASLKRFKGILEIEPDIKDEVDADQSIEISNGNIDIKSMSFTYPQGESPAMKGINLSIKAGDTIGIVGRTGSGKTTLVNLLVRLFDPDEGEILIDERNIKDYTLKNLRKAIGYVPQDNFLFSDTIHNNIGLGLDEHDLDMVEEMAKIVNVHDDIMEFEDDYKTIIGERGVTLSGGQKQRLSIARSLLIDPPILILDDAVSAVDTKTEEHILRHIKEMRKDKTTILIAHRISTIQDASKIFVIDQGEILEQGNHKELLELKGLYGDMFTKQQLEKSILAED